MDDVTAAKMNFRKEQWKQLILERQASDFSINNWCQQHGFKRTTYFYWLRRIRQEACQTLQENWNLSFYRPADRRSFFTRQGSMLLGAYIFMTVFAAVFFKSAKQ